MKRDPSGYFERLGIKGGAGSGNFGHSGRPGERGGSGEEGGRSGGGSDKLGVDAIGKTAGLREDVALRMSDMINGKIVHQTGDANTFHIVSNHSAKYINDAFKAEGFKKTSYGPGYIARGNWAIKATEGAKWAEDYDRKTHVKAVYIGKQYLIR